MDKKKPFLIRKVKDNIEKAKERILTKKMKQMKRKRLIIRNLSFKVSEDELKKIFSEFGEVIDIKLPLRSDGKKRGFAFIQFKDTHSQIKAMKQMNFKEILGRPIAIDFAVDKTTYKSHQNSTKTSVPLERDKLNETSSNSEGGEDDDKSEAESQTNCENDVTNASEDEEDSKVKAFFEEFDANQPENSEMESSDENSDDADDQDESADSDEVEDDSSTRNVHLNKKRSEDISEGKTVFIRNISFNNTEDELKEVVQEYGDIVYCLFCMDPLTDQFKGSAFVKFKERECADKLIQKSSKEPGILLDNRALNCTRALSREELSKQSVPDKVKDKRNLNLLKHGLIVYGSKEAEGVSKTDMAKRAQLELAKKQKLKNVNFFVSDKRLIIHNLPKNINDKDLRFMFKNAAGKGAVIKEARVMRDFKKTDAQGVPVSRGFGFVSFSQHEHALKALMELNNNPKIFTSNMRPIVEFSVENKVALLSQERRKEFFRIRNKKKVEEEMAFQSEEQNSSINIKRNKKNSHQQPFSKSAKTNNHRFQKKNQNKRSGGTQETSSGHISSSPSGRTQETAKKKQKKPLKGNAKTAFINAQERKNLSALANKYKEKLLNKYS